MLPLTSVDNNKGETCPCILRVPAVVLLLLGTSLLYLEFSSTDEYANSGAWRKNNSGDVYLPPEMTFACTATPVDASLNEENATDKGCQPILHPAYASSHFYTTVMERLHHKRLVFVGDSVTRYLYLSLARFLTNGTWGTTCIGDQRGDLLTWERRHKDWTSFYQFTNEQFGGLEVCDCYRPVERHPESITEDRYLFLPTYNLSVSYIQFFTPHMPIHGHWANWRIQEARIKGEDPPFDASVCASGYCPPPYDMEFPLHEAIPQVLAPLRPTTIVLNTGLWKCLTESWGTPWLDRVLKHLDNLTESMPSRSPHEPYGPPVIWRSTTGIAMGKCEAPKLLDMVLARNWSVVDTFHITGRPDIPRTDGKHYENSVYAAINAELLSVIVDLPVCRPIHDTS